MTDERDYWRKRAQGQPGDRPPLWTRRVERRRFLGSVGVAGLGLGAALLAACKKDTTTSGGSQPGAIVTSAPPSAAPQQAKYGGAPKLVWDTEPVGVFDPHITASGFVLSNRGMVFNGFYRWDYPDIKTNQPELITTQENPQPGAFTFKLRPGVKLHDESEEVTADLVKWNIERNLEQGKQQFGGFTGAAKGLKAEAIDPATIKFTFDPPSVQNVEVFLAMGSGITCVVSRQAAEKLGKEFWRTPVGTGPFTLTKWEYGSSITYKKWPRYFLKDKANNALPYVDEMTVIDLTDPSVRILNLQSGQADMAPIQPSDVQTLKSDANVQIAPSGQTRMQFTLNHNKPPFDNMHYRHALNYAMDRKAIADALYFGYGKPAAGIEENSQWYNKDFQQAGLDEKRVKDELAAAGTPNGFKFSVAVLPAGVRRQMAELIQGQLKKYGIEMEILPMESVDYVSRLYMTGELQGFLATNAIPGQGEASGFEGFRTSAARKDIKDYPELLAITDKIPVTFDKEARKRLIWDAQEMYYKTLSIQPVVVDTPALYAIRKKWAGLAFIGPVGLAGNYPLYREIRQA
jgi:peptide/nickel transport system substrate-binding protein